jgi:cyclic dehypoxanthinyl futalosine synthase
VIYDASLDELLQKVWDGQRINAAEAKRLAILPLEELGALADHRRQLAKAKAYDGRGNEIVTYNVDRNVNYTNVCNVYCKFCAFYRTEKDLDSYVISHAEMDQKIEETLALGGTQILMQGGHHPETFQAVVSGFARSYQSQVSAGEHPRLQSERVYSFPRSV